MAYLDSFYTLVNADTDFKKVVAAVCFEATMISDVLTNEYAFLDNGVGNDNEGLDFELDEACNYIEKEDTLIKEINYLANAFGDWSYVTGEYMLNMKDSEIELKALEYLKEHRIPNAYLGTDEEITDEQWRNTLEDIINSNTDHSVA